MELIIEVDIDIEESGLERESVKDNITDFTIDLLLIGAAEREIAFSLREVTYED